ncbi:helix-turn-helix domain-containing protein [Aggregatibacter actinomycetemcomitans]|uniref:helix-turn-helix domain-containing protein n=1 Tax=Aggregatibacter actinomycetemcomitans TaxID=714 RepID=UPI001E46DA71|nr:helix-turn-helix domain-containing protein [Aggregatibacter actinomycetemcomitans]
MTNSANFIHPRHHPKLTRGRIILKKGNVYINREDGEQYELVEYLDENAQVLIRNLHTRQCKITSIYQLENVKINEREDLLVDLSEISDEYWEKALERYEMIKPLLEREQPIKERAAELGVSERSLYRWLNAYNALGSVAGLVERKRGWSKGNSRLTKEQDELVTTVINEFYLHKQRPTAEQTIREVQRVASQKGIKSPCHRTITLRISSISEEEKLRKRGQKEKAKNKFTPKPNSFPNADHPLSVIQIDHTPVDLIIVDNQYRKPIGRPYLTLAMDVYSRMITHFKPNGLRANLTVLRWLLDTHQVVIDEALKDDLAELERIQALFNKLKESVPCIASYYQMLQQRFDSGKTSLKSVRLALQPAIDLINSQAVTDYPTQEQLNHYLSEKIGQMAAITGFINHLKSVYYRELDIDRNLIQQMKAKRLKKHYSQRLVELYKQTELTTTEQMELVSVVLYSLHGIEIKKPKLDAIVLLDGVTYYRDKTKDYFLPQDIYLRIKPQF